MTKSSNHGIKFKSWEEKRRLRAYELNRQGWRQVEIAAALGVTKGSVSKWIKKARKFGKRTLIDKSRPGASRKLTPEQLETIPEFLWHGAESYGFLGNVWTCKRIATVIKREFGVQYHKDHVGRLLKELGWTPQKPIIRASQRNENKINEWRTEVWPGLKKSEKGRKNYSLCR